MSHRGFCRCATAEEVTTQKVRNPPTPKLQKASGTLDFLFVMGWELAHKTIIGSVRGLQHTLSSGVIKCTAIRLSPRK